jgi:tetratricopeptide (TPR) repeat protein
VYQEQRTDSSPNNVYVVSLSDGATLQKVNPTNKTIKDLQISPDGRRLLIVAPYFTTLYKIVREGDERSLKIASPTEIGVQYAIKGKFSSDSKLLALGSGSEVIVCNAENGQRIAVLHPNIGGISLLCFSPNGRILAVGGQNQTLTLWNTDDFSAPPTKIRHTSPIWRCNFSPDSRLLLTMDAGSSARLWDLQQSIPEGRTLLRVHGIENINELEASPDGRWCAALRVNGTITVVNARTGIPPFAPFPVQPTYFIGRSHRRMQFSSDGNYLVFQGDDTVSVFDMRSGKLLWKMSANAGKNANTRLVRAIFLPGSSHLVTADASGTVKLWEQATGKPIGKPFRRSASADAGLSDIAIHPDGDRIALLFQRETISWNWKTGRIVPMEGTTDWRPGDKLDFSPDGKTLICYGSSNAIPRTSAQPGAKRPEPHQVNLWNADTGKIQTRLLHTEDAHAVAFSPDSKRVMTAAGTNAYLWNAMTGQTLSSPLPHPDSVTNVAFTRDGVMGITGCMDSTLRIWDGSGEMIFQRTGKNRNAGAVVGLTLSPDGREIWGGGWIGAAAWEIPRPYGIPDELVRTANLLACEEVTSEGGSALSQARLDVTWKQMSQNPLIGGLNETSPQILRRQAIAYLDLQQWKEAERLATATLDHWPADADALIARMVARTFQGHFKEALEDSKRLQVQGDPSWLPVDVGILLCNTNDMEQYRQLCRNRLEIMPPVESLSPDDFSPLRVLTLAPGGLDNYDSTIQIAERGIARYPTAQAPQYLLIGLLYRAGRYEEALNRYENFPTNRGSEWPLLECGARYYAAFANARLNRMDRARELFTQARQLRSKLMNVWRYRLETNVIDREGEQILGKTSVARQGSFTAPPSPKRLRSL